MSLAHKQVAVGEAVLRRLLGHQDELESMVEKSRGLAVAVRAWLELLRQDLADATKEEEPEDPQP